MKFAYHFMLNQTNKNICKYKLVDVALNFLKTKFLRWQRISKLCACHTILLTVIDCGRNLVVVELGEKHTLDFMKASINVAMCSFTIDHWSQIN